MKRKFLIITFLIIAVIAIFLTGCQQSGMDLSKRELHDMKGNLTNVESICKDHEYNLFIIWQPNCPPCKREMNVLKEMKFVDNLQLVAIGFGEFEELMATADDWKIPWPILKASDDFYEGIREEINATPALLLLDEKGRTKGKPFKTQEEDPQAITKEINDWLKELR